MQMFESLLSSIPKNRSEMVNDLDLPDDITPYVWTEADPFTARSDSLLSTSTEELDVGTLSTDSSLALSRAMTDSEIDYERSRRLRNRRLSDPWADMRAALDAFPSDYLASLNSFQTSSSDITEDYTYERERQYNDELRLKMKRFFDEECRVFTPDDPGYLTLQEALRAIDLKAIESDLDSITP